MRVCRRIRDLRLERDIPIAELAAASGLHFATIAHLEAGNPRRGKNVKLSTLIRIADALGIDVYELVAPT